MFGHWRRSPNRPDVAERFLDDGRAIVRQRVQDVEPTIERLKRVRSATDGRTPGGGQYLGSVPTTVLYGWFVEWERQGLIAPNVEGGMERVNDLIVAKLRDGDFSKFRATDRRL